MKIKSFQFLIQTEHSDIGACSLIVKTKDLRCLRLDLPHADSAAAAADSLEKLSLLDDVRRSFAFAYRPPFKPLEDGWLAFQPEEEFSAVVAASKVQEQKTEWRISYINRDFKVQGNHGYLRSLFSYFSFFAKVASSFYAQREAS